MAKKLNDLSKNVGKRLYLIRQHIAGNLNQGNFCKEIKVLKQGYLSRYESGERRPSWEVLIAISKKYNISLDWILKGESKEQITSLLEEKISFEGKFKDILGKMKRQA